MTTKASLTAPFSAAGKSGSPILLAAFACLVLLPGVLAFFVLYTQRLPFPFQDDYKALLVFAVQYVHAPDLAAKALQITAYEFNGYRLIFEHFVVAAQAELIHRVNFGFLTALGDLFLIGIFALLWLSFGRKPIRSKLIQFVPISLLFFSLSYWETLNWAEASLQNVPVIFFALAALYLLCGQNTVSNRRFFAACIAALLCCCSSPNGFLLAPVGLLILISWRSYLRAVFWCFILVLPFCAYLYHPVRYVGPVHSHLRQGFYFFAFFGCAFPWRFVAFPIGAIVLAVAFWAARSGFVWQNPVMSFLGLWIFLTGGVVEAVRMEIPSRYSMYSLLMLICCYVFLLNRFEAAPLDPVRRPVVRAGRKYFVEIAIVCSLCFYIQSSFRAYHQLHMRRAMVIGGLKHYLANPQTNSPQANPLVDELFPEEKNIELNILNRAKGEHIYTAPSESEIQKY